MSMTRYHQPPYFRIKSAAGIMRNCDFGQLITRGWIIYKLKPIGKLIAQSSDANGALNRLSHSYFVLHSFHPKAREL